LDNNFLWRSCVVQTVCEISVDFMHFHSSDLKADMSSIRFFFLFFFSAM
jgi:hypothetical protein